MISQNSKLSFPIGLQSLVERDYQPKKVLCILNWREYGHPQAGPEKRPTLWFFFPLRRPHPLPDGLPLHPTQCPTHNWIDVALSFAMLYTWNGSIHGIWNLQIQLCGERWVSPIPAGAKLSGNQKKKSFSLRLRIRRAVPLAPPSNWIASMGFVAGMLH